MAPEDQHISMSHASPARYEAVETSYDPGQFLASDDASNAPSPAPSKERTRPKHAAHHDYKPTALRWWFHAFLIACLATFIGLIEYTIRTLQAYDGDDLASQLWSRENSDSYQDIERKSKTTQPYFQHMSRAFGNTTSVVGITTTVTTALTILEDGKTTTTLTGLGDTTSATAPIAYPSDGKVTTTTTVPLISFTTAYLDVGKTTSTSTTATGSTVLSSEATTTLAAKTTGYFNPSKTTSTSTVVTGISSKSQGLSESAHVISVASPSTTTTEADITATMTKDTSAYVRIGPTLSSTTVIEYTTSEAKSAGLQLPTTVTQPSGSTSPTTESESKAAKDTSTYTQIGPLLSTTEYLTSSIESIGLQLGSSTSHSSGPTSPITESESTPTKETSAYIQIGPIPSSTTVIEHTTTTAESAGLQLSSTTSQSSVSAENVGSTNYLVMAGQTPTPQIIEIGPEAPSTVVGSQGTDGPSREILGPAATTILQETAAGKTPIATVVQGAKTWTPSETWIEKTITDSEGRSTVQSWKTTLPGSTSVFQSTMIVPSESHQGDVTVIQQTETWASSETTIEHTTINTDGRTIVQALETKLPGGTRTIQSTVTVSSISVSLEGHQEDVTVIKQTETWPSTELTIKQTTTNADGQIVVQTLETSSPGGTRIIESSVSVHPGETLVTVPTVMPTTIGGSTEVVQVTFSDSQGHTTISSYTTVIGGTPTFTTRSFFIATSLPPEDTVITIPTVVPTTLGGTTEVEETTFTDAHGSLTTSSYTTILGGTPTSTTVPVVIATPVPSGDVLVTISTVVPTTIGGTTEVVQTTFTDAHGQLTTSSYTTVLHGTPTSTTEWTIVPTPTAAGSAGGPSSNSDTRVIVYGVSLGEYLLGTFLPTILAVLVAFPVKLISINARLMHPFHTLATVDKTSGATLELSLFQRFDTWFGAFSLPLAIKRRQPVIAISDLLAFGAALLTALAAETVSVHVPDDCHSHCMGSLEVSVVVGRIVEVLMAIMAALLIALVVLLSVFRWRTGVSQNPWSIAGMASLCLDPETRDTLRSIPRGLNGSVEDSAIVKVLQENRYALGDFWTAPNPKTMNSKGYGVVVAGRDGVAKQLLERDESDGEEAEESKAVYERTQPFKLLTWWGRCLLIFVFSCILIILTYYENTSRDTGFERFMDSQGFGVNFFFTALGVVVGACMEMVFRSVAVISPYLQLSDSILPAERSILLSPPTNAFYGIYSAIRQRHLFLAVLSFTTILGELFLPVTLSQVPFSLNETFKTQLVCTWLSIAILALMILVLAASFLTTWPHMPVDPRTVAGAMFYVCDSWMLETLQGMSTTSKKDRDLDVKYLRLRYGYGYISGAVTGKERMGVDVCDDTGEAAVIMQNEKWRYN